MPYHHDASPGFDGRGHVGEAVFQIHEPALDHHTVALLERVDSGRMVEDGFVGLLQEVLTSEADCSTVHGIQSGTGPTILPFVAAHNQALAPRELVLEHVGFDAASYFGLVVVHEVEYTRLVQLAGRS